MTKPNPATNYGTFKNRVLSSSKATRGTREVLLALVHHGTHHTDRVTITKGQVAEFLNRYDSRHVQRSLAKLREAGTIEILAGGKGGRTNAVTYRLCIPDDYQAKEYDPTPPGAFDYDELNRRSYSDLSDTERKFMRDTIKRRNGGRKPRN